MKLALTVFVVAAFVIDSHLSAQLDDRILVPDDLGPDDLSGSSNDEGQTPDMHPRVGGRRPITTRLGTAVMSSPSLLPKTETRFSRAPLPTSVAPIESLDGSSFVPIIVPKSLHASRPASIATSIPANMKSVTLSPIAAAPGAPPVSVPVSDLVQTSVTTSAVALAPTLSPTAFSKSARFLATDDITYTDQVFEQICQSVNGVGKLLIGGINAICDIKIKIPVGLTAEGKACGGGDGGWFADLTGKNICDIKLVENIADVVNLPEIKLKLEDKSICELASGFIVDGEDIEAFLDRAGKLADTICKCLPEAIGYLKTNGVNIANGEVASEAVEAAVQVAVRAFNCIGDGLNAIESNQEDRVANIKMENDLVLWGVKVGLPDYLVLVSNIVLCVTSSGTQGCFALIENLVEKMVDSTKAMGLQFVDAVFDYYVSRLSDTVLNSVIIVEENLLEALGIVQTAIEECQSELEQDFESLTVELMETVMAVNGTIMFMKDKIQEVEDCKTATEEAINVLRKVISDIIDGAPTSSEDFIVNIINDPDGTLNTIGAIRTSLSAVVEGNEVERVRECAQSLIRLAQEIDAENEKLQTQFTEVRAAVESLLDVQSCMITASQQQQIRDNLASVSSTLMSAIGDIQAIIEEELNGGGLQVSVDVLTYSRRISIALDLPCSTTKRQTFTLFGIDVDADVPTFKKCRWGGHLSLPNEHIVYVALNYPGDLQPPDSVLSEDPEIDINEVRVFDCADTNAFPGDGIDNNCDGATDDQLCNDSDMDESGRSLRDCMCYPPRLDASSLEDKVISCAADRSIEALGSPSVETDVSRGCLEGAFLPPQDTKRRDVDLAETCGSATYTRIFLYEDSQGQQSNQVSQTISTNAEPPALNVTAIQASVFYECTDEVEFGFLAPAREVAIDFVSSPCPVGDINVRYQDLQIDYVGCHNDQASDNHIKGWNIQRNWEAVNNCLQTDSFDQLVVMRDDAMPIFSSVPQILVQSCRSSFDPASSGFPVAVDNCDPLDVINPDWSQPVGERGGRIEYTDQGPLLSGCPRAFVRTFEVLDRVCNSNSVTQKIEAEAFEFVAGGTGSSTEYDSSSFLPMFPIRTGERDEFNHVDFKDDVLVMVSSDGANILPVLECAAHGTLEYLDKSLGGSWHQMMDYVSHDIPVPLESGKVVHFDKQYSSPSFTFELWYYLSLVSIFEEVGDEDGCVLFRIPVTCAEAVERADYPGLFDPGAPVQGRVAANLKLTIGTFIFESSDINRLYFTDTIPIFRVSFDEHNFYDHDSLLYSGNDNLSPVAVLACLSHAPFEFKAGDEWRPVPHETQEPGKYADGSDFINFSHEGNPIISIDGDYRHVLSQIYASWSVDRRVLFRFVAGCYQAKPSSGKGGKGGAARGRHAEGRAMFALEIDDLVP